MTYDHKTFHNSILLLDPDFKGGDYRILPSGFVKCFMGDLKFNERLCTLEIAKFFIICLFDDFDTPSSQTSHHYGMESLRNNLILAFL